MSAQVGNGSAVPTESTGADKVADLASSVSQVKINEGPVQAGETPTVKSSHVPSEPTNGPSANSQDAATPKKTLNLPRSAADGIIRKPFAEPLETAKPTPRPPLSTDQEVKYETLLKKVSAWTGIPETSSKGSKTRPLTDAERMWLTRDCLLRYLRATTWNVAQAENRLRNTLVWRCEYGLEKITKDYISVENETGKQVILGWDINARPCHYLRPSKQNTERSDRQIQHLVYMLERSIDLMPVGQETLALLINFAETKASQGVTLSQGKQTLNILQNHYPERLGRALVANVPFYISGFFKLITPFIDPVTREKIRFNEDMGLHVPRDQLMKESGGNVEFEYVHEEYWPALNELCELKRSEAWERWVKGGKRIGEYEAYLKGAEPSLAEREKQGATATGQNGNAASG
ncbi:CRAL-TRIO domain-containing protein C23B6.04c [Exophiala dermatitidis]|uniref:4-nitrophenyl phosphatase n=1 Tax=Exophiala dermatitidis (strain ATCC 34100 / CBS 525.76 / NIH/UT8656) TaxID=858893 RepID=H6BN03_EXODN|nr:4-nitrophenyl phosphatase [Exophiala dermatitidis NIH/UT8656]EHY53126.1 4-nitrophenyl phosphatase [Exophiala dermatitidis NIH/UT8656]